MVDWDKHVLAPVGKVFGETVTYTPARGAQFTITDAVFDEGYRDVNALDGLVPAVEARPVLGVRAAAFPAGITPAQNDKVYIPSVAKTFVVQKPEPDGHGHIKLLLNFVSQP